MGRAWRGRLAASLQIAECYNLSHRVRDCHASRYLQTEPLFAAAVFCNKNVVSFVMSVSHSSPRGARPDVLSV
jgi:hypothetical protein